MILKIDTTERRQVKVTLIGNDSKTKELTIRQKTGSQVLLPAIVKIVKDTKINLSDIKSIQVNNGPGSFTGTRIGVSVANALGFALDIPVNSSPRPPSVEAGGEARKKGSPRFASASTQIAGEAGKIVVPIYEKSKFDK